MREIILTYKSDLTTKEIRLSTEYIDLPLEEVISLMKQYIVLLGYTNDVAEELFREGD